MKNNTIAFFSNFMDHHTAPLCKELYKLTDGKFTYVELTEMPDSFKRTGYPDFSTLPFILPAWKSQANNEAAMKLSKDADVVIFNGYLTYEYAIIRAKNGGFSFDLSERLLKRGILNALAPGARKFLWYYHTLFKKAPFYKLCKSAYEATDQYRLHSYYAKTIGDLLSMSFAELMKKGESARQFVNEKKNNIVQTKRILEMVFS